jgi:hypothetical protein
MTFTTQMIKYLAIPLILVGCTAPVTDPPAHAFELEIEETHWDHVYRAIEYIKAGEREKKMTDPSDAINSALAEFNYGSNGSTESEELLQLPSNGNQ